MSEDLSLEFSYLDAPRVAGNLQGGAYKMQDGWFADSINANNYLSWNLSADVHRGANFSTMYGDIVAKYQAKNQFLRQGNYPDGASHRTEENWDLGGEFMNYTFFPSVIRHGSSVTCLSYVAMYTSKDPTKLLPEGHAPDFVKVQTAGDTPVTIHVDRTHLGDDSTKAAVISAINAGNPAAGSYLCFFPFVSKDQYYGKRSKDGPKSWAIHGASLGLAMFAAMRGFPSIHYTGYINRLEPNMRINKDYDKEEGNQTADALVAISQSFNIVENVSLLPYKMEYAMRKGFPLCIPFSTSYQQPLSKVMADPNLWRSHFQIGMAASKNIFTLSRAADGEAYAHSGTTILCGVTANDMGSLAAMAYINTYLDGDEMGYRVNDQQGMQSNFAHYAGRSYNNRMDSSAKNKALRERIEKEGYKPVMSERAQQHGARQYNQMQETAAKKAAKSGDKLRKQEARTAKRVADIKSGNKAVKRKSAKKSAVDRVIAPRKKMPKKPKGKGGKRAPRASPYKAAKQQYNPMDFSNIASKIMPRGTLPEEYQSARHAERAARYNLAQSNIDTPDVRMAPEQLDDDDAEEDALHRRALAQRRAAAAMGSDPAYGGPEPDIGGQKPTMARQARTRPQSHLSRMSHPGVVLPRGMVELPVNPGITGVGHAAGRYGARRAQAGIFSDLGNAIDGITHI